METAVSKTEEKEETVSTSGQLTEKQQKYVPSTRWPDPFEEMEHLFEEFTSQGWLRPSWGRLKAPVFDKLPHTDIIDRDDEIIIRAEIPGVDKKDINISMSDHTVTIEGKTRSEEKKKKGGYYRHEISSNEYRRTLSLPCEVDMDKTKATYKDGLLKITVPKREASKRHAITID